MVRSERKGIEKAQHPNICCVAKETERIACFHYSNLQPLWGYENQSKGSKFISTNKQNPNVL